MRAVQRNWKYTLIDARSFWQWFAGHSEALVDLLEQDDTPTSVTPNPLWADLMTRLRAVHPDLRLTVVYDPNGPLGLVGATGGLANFGVVIQMVVAAPPMPGWRIALSASAHRVAVVYTHHWPSERRSSQIGKLFFSQALTDPLPLSPRPPR